MCYINDHHENKKSLCEATIIREGWKKQFEVSITHRKRIIFDRRMCPQYCMKNKLIKLAKENLIHQNLIHQLFVCFKT